MSNRFKFVYFLPAKKTVEKKTNYEYTIAFLMLRIYNNDSNSKDITHYNSQNTGGGSIIYDALL